MSEDITEGGVKTPLGEVSFKGKRTAEFITIICLLLLSVLATLYWQHHEATRENGAQIRDAMKEMTVAQRDMVAAQREQICISALPEAERKAAFTSPYSLCKQMARER